MDQKPLTAFPISFLKTIHLIGSLSWLQVLYAVSYIVRPFWNTRREFPPFNRAIDRTEKSIINTILGTIALSAHSSEIETERQWYLSSGNGTLNNMRTTSQSIPSLLVTSPWPPDEHQDSDSSLEQESPTSQPSTESPRENFPIYETVRKLRSSTRGSISKLANSAKSIFRQPLTVLPRNMGDPSPDEERAERDLIPVPVHTAQPHFVQNMAFPAPMSASAHITDHFSDPGPSTGSKVQQPVSFGATIDAAADSDTVQMNRARKYQSVESYPGKFPVSDTLDYSSLASAYAVRGRGTTSVRPFSDY
ncbi:hypothetical protein CBS147333_5447 [Penicillium roqueforti]|nr:hypothetical protein CBS147355_8932 [Penicillium roqueforti]KAI2673179.1 hypothetical protein LCP963914a_9173 [Penicillium roqueforti]KAI3109462.1 hypothetical protein CBS147333_5447 [Penicillium roqueforti]KAI3212750.1 hypothetical protein CBS147311_323 [Penicillium roqueforti]KAI3260401.1 hypothetical protein CBS147309_7508 [Penicillium roqueforti]